jgi:diaminohydroxyphosphoribosylaminopyrimidine deaminase/5-amino-6-(5-phosphoribosylamino)uracil reductase
LIAAGVKKVFVAMTDPNPLVAGQGLEKLQAAGIETETGLLELQARDLNPGFIKRMESGRPFVRVKLAMSLDGRTAMASGESKWISSEASRHDVQCLRAESSAILTGIGTVLADNPAMNVRLNAEQLELDGISNKQPKRLVLDSQFNMPVDAQIASLDGECIVFTTVNVENKNDYPFTIETVATKNKQIDLKLLMNDLAKKEINLLHVEAGSVLSGALLKNDLVDEIIIYMAPHIMGDGAKGLFHLPGLEQMKDRISLSIKDVRSIGNDIRITAVPEYL